MSASKAKKRSAFFVTVNPNISRKDLPTEETRKIIYTRMVEFAKKVHSGLQDASLLKKIYNPRYQNSEPESESVTKFDYSIEIGEKLGFIHIHMFIKLEQACHLDQAKIRKIASAYIRGDRKKVHLNIKFVRDPLPSIQGYITKQEDSVAMGSI